jgi:cytoskeletal protein CcmA (bactofilin family)
MGKVIDIHQYEQTLSRFGRDSSLRGTLRFSTSVKLAGRFEGQIDSTGFLYIENGAEIRADIKARSIIVGGVVYGNMEASEKIIMLPSGRIHGNVRTAKLKIADGVLFEGKCEMIKRGEALDIFAAPVEQLKKSIQSV